MRKLQTVCFGLAVAGLVCMTATAEPPALLKKGAKYGSQLRTLKAAKYAPAPTAIQNAKTGKLVSGPALKTRAAGVRTNVFDSFNLPGSARGVNVSYVDAPAYTDPNWPSTFAYLWTMAWLPRSICPWGAPNDPFSGLPDQIGWDEYIVDASVWPGDPNADLAEVTGFSMVPLGFNEQPGPNDVQSNQLNILFFDPNGTSVQGGWRVRWTWPGGFAGWFASSVDAYCNDLGFDITAGVLDDPNDPNDVGLSGWLMYDWVNWNLDANGVPMFDPNDPEANTYCRAGMMIGGGIPNFDPNLGFGVVPDPNYPHPAETIQVGSTWTTILKDPNDPNSPSLDQIWLWSDGVSGLDPNCFDPNDPMFPHTTAQYLCAFNKTDPNFPFINWFGIDQRSQVLDNAFPFAILTKKACPGEDPNAGPTCRTDLDDDCFVGPPDLTLLLANWFQNKPEFDLDCDPNTPVGPQDLTLLLAEWFNDCN